MKNTIVTKKIGQHGIIDRFNELSIDPRPTEIKNRKVLSEIPEKKALDQQIIIKSAHNAKARDALSKMVTARKYIKDGETLSKITEDKKITDQIAINIERANAVLTEEDKKYKGFQAQSKACDYELDKLGRAFESKRRDHIRANPIYGHPRKNEVVITDSKYKELKALFDNLKNEQIKVTLEKIYSIVCEEVGKEPIKAPFQKLVNYEIIPDFRGCQYFYQIDALWVSSEIITKLGITKTDISLENSIEKKDLTTEQSEEIRIQFLDAKQKENEKQAMVANALARAGQMKNELEIQDKTAAKALSESKAWYQSELEKIELKYG